MAPNDFYALFRNGLMNKLRIKMRQGKEPQD